MENENKFEISTFLFSVLTLILLFGILWIYNITQDRESNILTNINNFANPIVTAITAIFLYKTLNKTTEVNKDNMTLQRLATLERQLVEINKDFTKLSYSEVRTGPKGVDIEKTYFGSIAIEHYFIDLFRQARDKEYGMINSIIFVNIIELISRFNTASSELSDIEKRSNDNYGMFELIKTKFNTTYQYKFLVICNIINEFTGNQVKYLIFEDFINIDNEGKLWKDLLDKLDTLDILKDDFKREITNIAGDIVYRL